METVQGAKTVLLAEEQLVENNVAFLKQQLADFKRIKCNFNFIGSETDKLMLPIHFSTGTLYIRNMDEKGEEFLFEVEENDTTRKTFLSLCELLERYDFGYKDKRVSYFLSQFEKKYPDKNDRETKIQYNYLHITTDKGILVRKSQLLKTKTARPWSKPLYNAKPQVKNPEIKHNAVEGLNKVCDNWHRNTTELEKKVKQNIEDSTFVAMYGKIALSLLNLNNDQLNAVDSYIESLQIDENNKKRRIANQKEEEDVKMVQNQD